MAVVLFYEKPGCGTNARQRRRLEAAGHDVVVRNLLTEPWTAERLCGFFGDTPVAAWFNPAAPDIKSGAVDPTAVDADEALALMLATPLLIRRPLIDAAGRKCAGFTREPVPSLLGGGTAPDDESCRRAEQDTPCPVPNEAVQP